MSVRYLLLTFLLAVAASSTMAHNHLVVNKDSSTEKAFSFSELKRINFVEGGLEFVADESLVMPFSEISTIHFDTKDLSDANDIAANGFAVLMDPARISMQIIGLDTDSPLYIYTTSGMLVQSFSHYNGEVVDIATLSEGTYIVKAGNRIFKFVK